MEKKPINEITTERGLHFKPYGWHHWPEHPWMSYQFRRALGETQKGDGAISECFPAAFRMVPGDKKAGTWNGYVWPNATTAEAVGHIETARNCWLRAVDYYRQAEFWLAGDDPRRLQTFDKLEECFHSWGHTRRPGIHASGFPPCRPSPRP